MAADFPPALLALVQKPRDKSDLAGLCLLTNDSRSSIASAIAEAQAADPAIQGDGGDNHTIVVANAIMDHVSPAAALEILLEHWNDRCEPPWDPEDLRTKVESAACSRQQPCQWKAVEADFPEAAAALAAGETIKILDHRAAPKATTASASAWRIFPATEAEVRLDKPDLVRGWIDPATVIAMYGPPNVGKSFLAIHLLAAVSRGAPWFGRATHQGVCLYVAMEGTAGIQKRLRAYQNRYGEAPHLHCLPRRLAINRFDAPDVTQLIRRYNDLVRDSGLPPGMIALDTVAKAMAGGDENSAECMSAFIAAAEHMVQETGATVVLIHHPGKDPSKGMRGSSALLGAIETTIAIQAGRNGGKLVFEKERDHGKPEPVLFALRQVGFGNNLYGDPVTSCVIEEGGASIEDDFDPPVDRLTPTLHAAFDAVVSAAAEVGKPEEEMVWLPRAVAADRVRKAKGIKNTRSNAGANAVDDLVTKEALERRDTPRGVEIGVPAAYVTPRAATASHSGQGVADAVH